MKDGLRRIHPGEFLREDFLKPLDHTIEKLAKEKEMVKVGISVVELQEILDEQSPVTERVAMALAKTLHTTPHYWLNIQKKYDLKSR